LNEKNSPQVGILLYGSRK